MVASPKGSRPRFHFCAFRVFARREFTCTLKDLPGHSLAERAENKCKMREHTG